MPPRIMSTDVTLLDRALDVLNENTKIIAENAAAVEEAEKARLQALADRGEVMGQLEDARAEIARARAILTRFEGRLDDRLPMPHIAPSHPLHLATADVLKSREGRVALVLLAAALALVALALAITAGLDPRILSELAP